jgi:hypothetical protein
MNALSMCGEYDDGVITAESRVKTAPKRHARALGERMMGPWNPDNRLISPQVTP